MDESTVEVIAVETGFFNGVLRPAGTTFRVRRGAETGSPWFRPIANVSVPQGEVEPEQKPKRKPKQDQADHDLG